MINKTIHYNQAKVNYAVYGNGMPVVLIHGFGEDSSIWKNQIPKLEEKYCRMLSNPTLSIIICCG